MGIIGKNLQKLICLQIRSCEFITDEGIIEFSENLSGYTKYKENSTNPNTHEHKTESRLEYLNIANDRVLTDKAISAIAKHLLSNLKDFCFVFLIKQGKNSMDAIK